MPARQILILTILWPQKLGPLLEPRNPINTHVIDPSPVKSNCAEALVYINNAICSTERHAARVPGQCEFASQLVHGNNFLRSSSEVHLLRNRALYTVSGSVPTESRSVLHRK